MSYSNLETGPYHSCFSLPSVHSLGLHVCRKMNSSSADLSDFEDNFKLMKHFTMPFDTDCVSENLLKTSFKLNTNYDVSHVLTRINEEGKFLLWAQIHGRFKEGGTVGGFFKNKTGTSLIILGSVYEHQK